MKPTDFAKSLTDFLTKYLPGERGMSINTIHSYKATFILYIGFMQQNALITVDKLCLEDITQETVIGFLDWVQSERGCSDSTRNIRLAAMHSFIRYLQYATPEHLYEWQRVLAIKVKKSKKKPVHYLSIEGIQLLLAQPDLSTIKGRRDMTMLSLMYHCGARVQEIIDLTPAMVRLEKPLTVKIIGKGNKARIIPLIEQQIGNLRTYLQEHDMLKAQANLYPLFQNSRREKLTRAGVGHILLQYAAKARKIDPGLIPDTLSCHTLRHSKAMHLLQAGVNLVYIRDILGHTSVQTTEIYARADSKQKREAIEKAYVEVVPNETPMWLNNNDLLGWLKAF